MTGLLYINSVNREEQGRWGPKERWITSLIHVGISKWFHLFASRWSRSKHPPMCFCFYTHLQFRPCVKQCNQLVYYPPAHWSRGACVCVRLCVFCLHFLHLFHTLIIDTDKYNVHKYDRYCQLWHFKTIASILKLEFLGSLKVTSCSASRKSLTAGAQNRPELGLISSGTWPSCTL